MKEMQVPLTTPLKAGVRADLRNSGSTTQAQQLDRGLLHGFVGTLGSRKSRYESLFEIARSLRCQVLSSSSKKRFLTLRPSRRRGRTAAGAVVQLHSNSFALQVV